MKTKLFRLVFFALVNFMMMQNNLKSQQNNTFEKLFGGLQYDVGNCLFQTQDKGFIITGQTMSMNDTLGNAYLIKTDSFGNTQWIKDFPHPLLDGGNCVTPTFDGGFLIAGHTETPTLDCQYYVLRLDSNGDTLWTKMFGGLYDDAATCAIQTTDGGFLISGYSEVLSDTDADGYLMKLNSIGDTVWTKRYGGNGNDIANNVKQATDGGYIIAGRKQNTSGDIDVCLIKTDSVGIISWQKTYGGVMDDYGYNVQPTTDGGYIISANTYSYGNGQTDAYLIKTDNLGDTIWTKTFGGSLVDYIYKVVQTFDGGYIAVGYTRSYGDTLDDVYVLKTDEFGDLQWFKNIGTNGEDKGLNIVQCADSTYAISGSTFNVFSASIDAMLIKMDTLGNSPTGIVVLNENKNIIGIYPNPCSSQFTVSFPKQQKNASLKIMNMLGQDVPTSPSALQGGGWGWTVDLTGVAHGIYFVEITDENKNVVNKKLVIQ